LDPSGAEFEILYRPMVDCILRISLEWTCNVFQTHEWGYFTFSKSEVLPVHLALLNLMCLHDIICDFLGVIKFDIELVALHFFENLLFLLILKCFVHYLGLPLIVILTYDMLWLPILKRLFSCVFPSQFL